MNDKNTTSSKCIQTEASLLRSHSSTWPCPNSEDSDPNKVPTNHLRVSANVERAMMDKSTALNQSCNINR